jgi:peptide/nickel transport system permease protein
VKKLMTKYHIRGIYFFAFVVLAIIILVSLFPGLFTRYSPYELVDDDLLPPSVSHLLGTDEIGRDVYARVVYGARTTMYVGVGSSILAVLIGIPFGLIAGYFSGINDLVIMRVLDSFMAFPAILLSVLIISVTGANSTALIFTISLVNFPRFARIVRSNTLYIKKIEFVEAARVNGASNFYIMFKSIFLNCISPIVVQFTLLVAVAILIEASMSFLGLGVQPPQPAWGSMLNTAQLYLRKSWWYAFAPGFLIFILVYSVNIFGDWLRDFTDPKKRSS